MTMFKFGSHKPAIPQAPVEEHPKNRLLVQLGTLGWSAVFLDETGHPREPGWQGDASHLDMASHERLEKITSQAIEDLKRGPLKSADAISIVVEGLTTVFVDSRQEGLRSASDAIARQYGQRMLNAPTTQAVSFGMAPFGVVTGQGGDANPVNRQQQVYAFADVRQLRTLLTLFDDFALKITHCTSKSYMILRQAAQDPQNPLAGLVMGSHHTTLILGHYGLSGVLVREIPVGLLSLAQNVADKAGVSLTDTLDSLGKRDLVARITPRPNPADKGLTANPYQAGLEPGLRQLLQDIQDSLEYFMGQKVCGKPTQLICHGPLARVQGLERWLGQHLQLKVVPPAPQGADKLPAFDECNLLRGAETSLVTVGKVRYSFSKNGFEKTASLATQTRGLDRIKAGLATQQRTDRRSGRTRKQRGASREEAGFMTGLVAGIRRMTSGASHDGDLAAEASPAEIMDRQTRQAGLVLLLLVGLVAYWGYEQIQYQRKVYLQQVQKYLLARDTNTKNLAHFGTGQINRLDAAASEETNRVFWTKKFLALSHAMNQHIWLTDIYLASAQMELAGAKVESKKMVMEGAVLPSWDGHIGRMSEFMVALTDEKNNSFMEDFRQVTFRGSELDRAEDIVRFGFEAWYDKNKRVEEHRKKINESDLAGNLDAIQESTKAKENVLQLKVR